MATEHKDLEDEKAKPSDGDISLCIECGEICEFSGGKTVKIDIESLDLETKKEVNRVSHAWLMTQSRRPDRR